MSRSRSSGMVLLVSTVTSGEGAEPVRRRPLDLGYLSAAALCALLRWLERKASPGRVGSHFGLLGWPLIESSNGFWGTSVEGASPPVALATAYWIAVRTIQFCESTVKSLKSGLVDNSFSRSHDSWLESSVATAGILRPACLKAPNELASAAPKSVVIASICGYLASSAVTTFWVCAGSQLVGLYGVCPTNLMSGWSLRTLIIPSYSSWLWELAGGPPRVATRPLPWSAFTSHWPHSTPACLKSVDTKAS